MNEETNVSRTKLKTKTVVMDTSGVVACGKYKAGVKYTIDAAEAERLIIAKGFTETTADDNTINLTQEG